MRCSPSEALEMVRNRLSDSFPHPEVTDDGVRITTHCMYPSNGLVRVYVKAGAETIVVSDEGEAIGEALAAGLDVSEAGRLARHVVAEQGLSLNHGIIHTPLLPLEAMPAAIPMVANAAKDVASWLYGHKKIQRGHDFRKLLSDYLARTFEDRFIRGEKIIGASNKAHEFANVVLFPNGNRLIVDPVARDASSINARVVANLDIRSNKNPTIEQRIVYDDADAWSSADLNLLSVGAPVVKFSNAAEVIARISARTMAAARSIA